MPFTASNIEVLRPDTGMAPHVSATRGVFRATAVTSRAAARIQDAGRLLRTILATALLLASAGCGGNEAPGIDAAALPLIKDAPSFTVPNYDGTEVSTETLAGNVYLVYFFFTSCGGPCPVINSTANVLQAEFADEAHFRLVGFTVDPDTDTQERLTKYARRYAAKPGRWFFLRTSKDEVAKLAAKGFLMGDARTPALHSTRFALVDARGSIRGYYDALDPAAMDALRQAIRALLAGGPA